jgi:predicted amidohydrolase
MDIVKAGVVQFDVKLGNVEANLAKVGQAVRALAAAGANVVLLPEMWSCGFDYDRMGQHAVQTPYILCDMGSLARECHVAIAGSLPQADGQGVKNTLYLVDEKGDIQSDYAKIHLFSPGGEHDHFAAGDRPMVCDTEFGRSGFMICYDLRFPELCRALALDGAMVVMISAQWPLSRLAHWETLVKARAIENQVFVLAANRCGKDEQKEYAGHSMIVSPWGECLAQGEFSETNLFAEFALSDVTKVREAIPCFADRRPGVYGNGVKIQ